MTTHHCRKNHATIRENHGVPIAIPAAIAVASLVGDKPEVHGFCDWFAKWLFWPILLFIIWGNLAIVSVVTYVAFVFFKLLVS